MSERFCASIIIGHHRSSRCICHYGRCRNGAALCRRRLQTYVSANVVDRLAEATAEKLHEEVRKKLWGYAPDENLSIKDLHNEKYQGIRPAVGYPSLPDQSVNFLLDELLDMNQIGISLTENGMMKPHASVCGLMFAHPASRYFSIGKIGEDQLANYAARRGMSIEETKKFLATNL